MRAAGCRRSGQPPPAQDRRADRALVLVGSEAGPLTFTRPTLRADAVAIFEAAIAGADAAVLTTRALLQHPLSPAGAVLVLAVGKAAPAMARAAAEAFAGRLQAGLAIGAAPSPAPPPAFAWHPSSHPVPDERSVAAGRAALAFAERVPAGAPLLVLLSGGASSLMAVPAGELTLADKQDTTRRLLAVDAPIQDVNCVRRHLSAVKGGRLAAAAGSAHLTTLAISDVVGDDPSVIGSGPTVPDPTTWMDALGVLDAHGGRRAFRAGVVQHLEGAREKPGRETPKPGDPRFARSVYRVIGSARDAVAGARRAAEARGYAVLVLDRPLVGEARDAARTLADRIAEPAARGARPLCVIGAGETTVTVSGTGRGGRNQELALALADWAARQPHPVAIACAGTDGVDGPTDAAGAVVDDTTLERARRLGLDPHAFLADNDAWRFFAALDDLIRTGPTGTNVGDVQIVLMA